MQTLQRCFCSLNTYLAHTIIHTKTQTHTHQNTHSLTPKRTLIHTQMHTRYTPKCTLIHTNTHTHTHVRVCVHTHLLMEGVSLGRVAAARVSLHHRCFRKGLAVGQGLRCCWQWPPCHRQRGADRCQSGSIGACNVRSHDVVCSTSWPPHPSIRILHP